MTVRDENTEILADLIVGNRVTNRPGLRFVRMPEQKRVYTARFEADISTRFEDWIERKPAGGRARPGEPTSSSTSTPSTRSPAGPPAPSEFIARQGGRHDLGTAPTSRTSRKSTSSRVNRLVGAVIGLRIAGVPSQAGGDDRATCATPRLAGRIGQADIIDLINKGFYPTAEGGLLSNEGELLVRTTEGVLYTLRFGEIVYGRGDAILLGSDGERRRRGRAGREPLRLHHRGVRRGGAARAGRVRHRRPRVVGTAGSAEEREESRAPRRAPSPAGTTSSRPAATTASTSRAGNFLQDREEADAGA